MSEQNTSGDRYSDISEIKSYLTALKQIDFELAYLALLTYQGLKPLSRWEKPPVNKEIELLQNIGLLTKQITRTVKSGKEVFENVFSRKPAYIHLYEQRFSNTPIDKSAETQRFEGFLFGFPPCCIEQYILKPYSENNLEEKDQKILFHWACENCQITPVLLSSYRKIYDILQA